MKLRNYPLPLALVATLVAGSAHAAMENANNTTQGNSSVIFLALDVNSNIGLTLDLGLRMSDFTNSNSLTSGLTGPLTWDFSANTTTAPVTGTNGWTAAYELFKATQSGGDFLWGVVAADQISGTGITGTNAIPGRGLLATGNATQDEMLLASTSAPTGNAIGNFINFVAGNNNLGSHSSVDNGANTVTASDGLSWTPELMGNNFGGFLTWSYLLANGETSTFQWQQQLVANPVVQQFGNPTTTDALSPAPIAFTFDIATNQLVLSPVPEPGTYAMLLAGLGAMGFMVRRRSRG